MEWGNDSVDLCANYSSLKTESCILESALVSYWPKQPRFMCLFWVYCAVIYSFIIFSSSLQETRANAISGIRIVSSSLGYVVYHSILGSTNQCFKLVVLLVVRILGAMSIIVSAVVRRRVLNSEVHPIFMISLADCMLGVLWIVGAVLWFIPHGTFNHVWCYALTLLTAVSSLILPYVLMWPLTDLMYRYWSVLWSIWLLCTECLRTLESTELGLVDFS